MSTTQLSSLCVALSLPHCRSYCSIGFSHHACREKQINEKPDPQDSKRDDTNYKPNGSPPDKAQKQLCDSAANTVQIKSVQAKLTQKEPESIGYPHRFRLRHDHYLLLLLWCRLRSRCIATSGLRRWWNGYICLRRGDRCCLMNRCPAVLTELIFRL